MVSSNSSFKYFRYSWADLNPMTEKFISSTHTFTVFSFSRYLMLALFAAPIRRMSMNPSKKWSRRSGKPTIIFSPVSNTLHHMSAMCLLPWLSTTAILIFTSSFSACVVLESPNLTWKSIFLRSSIASGLSLTQSSDA